MAENTDKKMEYIAEPEADMLKGLKRVASGELQICGIEYQNGGYHKK
jgi:hypothetical protein